MPSDVMDQRHISSSYRPSAPSSFFSENTRFPSEKQFGFASIASLPDHNGLEAMSLGGNAISSSTLENICPIGGKFVESLEIPHGLFKNLKINNNIEHHLIRAGSTVSCLRAPDQDGVSPSMLCSQPASLSLEAKKVDINGGHYKNGFFPSSLSDVLNKTLRLSSNDIFVDRSVNTIQPNIAEVEAFESVDEAEAQTIRDLLPDDDDLLSGALHDLGYVARSNRVDVEDDLFCSVGGMELESDNFVFKEASEYDIEGAFNGQERGLDNIPSSEFAQGEQPTRTLYVENIISSIEDSELRILFEQFGDIQTFLTSCGQRGCTIVSYYDIRAAQNAKRVLQSKSIRGQKLDMRFCVSKGNSSGREINEGVLLVTNLESSILNVDLLHIFGVYGEIKQICQIPHNRHHKCIEFYDVRAADAALSAINKCDVAGRRIKVEPWDQREPIISSKQQVSVDLEEEESSRCRVDSYSKKLPCFVPSGLIKLGANTSSDLHNDATQGMHTAFEMQIGSCTESKSHGISSSIHHNLSSTGIVAMVENHFSQSSNYENTNSIRRMNHGFENMATFPEFHGGVASGVSFNSPSTMSGMAMNASSTLANGIDNRNIHRVSSGSHGSHFKHNEAGNGSFPLHGHEFIWNGPNTYHHHYPGSLMWQNLPPLVNNIPFQSPQMGLARGSMLNPVLPPNLHVGSAPVVDPLFWNARHATFTGDATSFDSSSLASLGYSSCSQLQSLEHNIFPQASGTCIDPSIATKYIGVPSTQQKGHMFRGRNNLVFNSRDAPSDRIRSRRSDTSSSNADSRKQYELDIDRIIQGDDARTTLMIKNIPNKYTSKMLLATIDEQHKGTYDFIYLPIDFKNKCNVGYAFINMTDPGHIIPFYKAFNGKKWEKFNSEKVAYLAYARIQGKYALIAHFQNSSLMNEDKRCRPILFHSEGPNAGDQEPFPVGVNIQSRRWRTRNENHLGSPPGSSSSDDGYSSSAGSTKKL